MMELVSYKRPQSSLSLRPHEDSARRVVTWTRALSEPSQHPDLRHLPIIQNRGTSFCLEATQCVVLHCSSPRAKPYWERFSSGRRGARREEAKWLHCH